MLREQRLDRPRRERVPGGEVEKGRIPEGHAEDDDELRIISYYNKRHELPVRIGIRTDEK